MSDKAYGTRNDATAAAECSCGAADCRELGWPHEWDPIAAGDDCSVGGLGENPHVFGKILSGGRIVVERQGHKVAKPFVRYGCGYACVDCVEGAASREGGI